MTIVTRELPEHFDEVRQLTIDAFTASEFGHNGEAELIDVIRSNSDDYLSLVAIKDDRVVGHILFSSTTIHSKGSIVNGMGLAPMAVLPTYQRSGIGTALVNEGLQQLADTSATFTIVAGHTDYYPRFGFLPAQDYAVTHGFEGMPQEILFVRPRNATTASAIKGGLAYYHTAFGPQHSE